jgi:short-subunit dehydrogenase
VSKIPDLRRLLRLDGGNDSWADKTVLVTGASSGIGEALARHLASRGAKVLLAARRRPELERVGRSLDHAERHRIWAVDLSDSVKLPQWAKALEEQVGQIDALFANAGVSQRSEALETRLQVERRLFAINYWAPIILTKTLAPAMVERGEGQICVVTSVMGKLGTPRRSSYAATKHALHGYFDCLRHELGADGVKVTLAVPGYVQTRISINALTGTGEPLGEMRKATEEGMDADVCAKRILRAVERGKNEVLIAGARETAGVWLKRLAPGLLSRVVDRLDPS